MNETTPTPPNPGPPGWERDLLEKVLLASLTEQRRARRWNIFFKALLFLYVAAGLAVASAPWLEKRKGGGKSGHTAVVDVAGMIAPGLPASADNVMEGLRDAADNPNTKGIVLRMNTPGGSPVQAAYIYDEIRRLKALKPERPIFAIVVDTCASGGYYIAAAADKIFVNPSSVVGSIGVIMSNFGFVGAMDKLGVERRVMTAGTHKAILDPFSPVDPVAQEHVQKMLTNIHGNFIQAVKQGRGERLKETPDMFSGLIWTGQEAIDLGLADATGDLRYVAEEIIGAKNIVNFTPEENLLDRVTHQLGTSLGAVLKNNLVGPELH